MDLVEFLNARLAEDEQAARKHSGRRALDEVESKRRIMARHVLSPAEGDPERPWADRDDCQYDGESWPCPDLVDLAHAYATHPEHRDQWHP